MANIDNTNEIPLTANDDAMETDEPAQLPEKRAVKRPAKYGDLSRAAQPFVRPDGGSRRRLDDVPKLSENSAAALAPPGLGLLNAAEFVTQRLPGDGARR